MPAKRVQNIRSIKKAENHNNSLHQVQEFPRDKPGVIYVRQSTMVQVQKNLHSFEMQTSEFEKYFRDFLGVTGKIEIIADDEGKSGTLSIHDRKGLSRVTRLIEGIELLDGQKIGWIGAVHVNRLTRDPWLIVPGVLMKECFEHDVWIATLRMNFNFKDEYCQRVFMLEAEESARHLKWMKEVMGGGLRVASDKGIYDGRSVIPGYIVDYREYINGNKKNPNYKKYIIYKPHAEIVLWLFTRFLELDGNFPALCREVEGMPYLFPPLEQIFDRKNVTRFSEAKSILAEGPYQGSYKPTARGLFTLLTNPTYRGWWVPRGGGLVENNQSAIIDEALFTYAYNRLSTFDLRGNRVNHGRKRAQRNGKAEALLKKVICGPEDNHCIYPTVGRGKLRYRSRLFSKLSRKEDISIDGATIDAVFTEKFFEKLDEWQANGDLDQWREILETTQSAKDGQKKQIKKAIKEAEARMQQINEIITDIDNLPSNVQRAALMKMYDDLAEKAKELDQEMQDGAEVEEEEDTVTLYQIWALIPKVKEKWKELSFHDKMTTVNAFTRKVVMSAPSPGWLKLEVEWKIGERDVMHQQRTTNGRIWSKDEEVIIRDLWPNGDGAAILNQLSSRSYSAIKKHAGDMGVKRETKGGSIVLQDYWDLSIKDKQYAEEFCLDTMSKKPQWSWTSSSFTDCTEDTVSKKLPRRWMPVDARSPC